MFIILCIISFSLSSYHCQTIKHLNEISIEEELPINSMVTSLTDKIPNLDQSNEYDLVTPLSTDLDLFSINHSQHTLIIKTRIDYETICLKTHHCIVSVSIAVSNEDTIDVYILPIRIINKNDNLIRFLVNRTIIEIEENDENWFQKTYSLPKAYDDDSDSITYSIYLQNWNRPDGLFEFDEKNLLLKPLKKFDREEQNIYLLRLIAHNQNDVSTDIIIVIKDLNDNIPICHHNQALFLISNISSISKFQLNATDYDEGDNGTLEYSLMNSLVGFSIDRFNGDIKFDYTKWIRSNQSILIINVTDHGKPFRLSTKCSIEIQLTFLYDIDFKSNISSINRTEVTIDVESVDLALGLFAIYDKQYNNSCHDCLIHINTSVNDIFSFNYLTYELYLNLNSVILMKILTNYFHNKENVSLNVQIDVINLKYPSIRSTKMYLFIINFNKLNLLMFSNTYFLKVHDNILLNERISIFNRHHRCLNNQSNELILNDPTDTFDIGKNFNLILKKHLNAQQQRSYDLTLQQKQKNSTDDIYTCSVQIRLYILNPYSSANVFPYFSQSFYILSSKNLSEFSLPPIPSYAKYASSVPDLISIDPYNASIIVRSSLLYSSYSYDFRIEAIDSRSPSLSCSIPIRVFFGVNKFPPQLLINSTRQFIEILPSKFLYQIKAYDPDLLLSDQTNSFPPTVEYEIDSSMNIEIERYTGRIFLKDFNTTNINFTLFMKDFGQPNRFITRQTLIFDIKSNENISLTVFFIAASSIIFIVIVLSILTFIIHYCCTRPTKTLKTQKQTTWKNISPTTPDTCLIDNEYMSTTVTSLPRTSSREQRIYPTFSYVHVNNDGQHQRRMLSHSSLDKINFQYSSDKISYRQDSEQRLSMADINKYLERFEKLYNDSSSQQYLHQPMGSVV
ncbi:unnamed protein product [Rotaria magnacalcarata]